MNTLSNYKKLLIGKNNGENIYLSPPSWDCGWYWGFGYLGNRNCHYHIDGLGKDKRINMFDAFKEHFGESLMIRDSQLWKVCELFKSFYILKESAEILGRGGAHYTSNPCQDIIKNENEAKRINEVVIPAIFEELYKILNAGQKKDEQDKHIVQLCVGGDTKIVYEYMIANGITTDDLKNVNGVINSDYQAIHTFYWKMFHSKK